jgi:hypothetical protein
MGEVKITMDEVHKAISEYVERKYSVKATGNSIHYTSYGSVTFQGATVKYQMIPKDIT